MPFTITLMTADLDALQRDTKVIAATVQADHGRKLPHGVIQLTDGGQLTFSVDQFATDKLTLDACRLIFKAALDANMYIDSGGSDVTAIRVKGSTPAISSDIGPVTTVSDSRALCTNLIARENRWNKEMAQLQKDGVIGPDDQPLEPPAGPGTEARLSDDPSGVAAKCDASEHKLESNLHWKLMRSLVTRNAQWGIVWRADVAPEPDPTTWFRVSCWRSPHGHHGYSISTQPLQMFDKSQSVTPLPAK